MLPGIAWTRQIATSFSPHLHGFVKSYETAGV